MAVRNTTSTLARLEAALDAPGIPPKAAAGCRSLIEKLRRPVQVGLFGLPGSGKSMILNALAGQTVVPQDLDLPTLEVSHGPDLGLTAIFEDGSRVSRPGLPGPDLLDEAPVFVRVRSPETTLQGLSVLNVVAEQQEDDLEAALHWGAARCDIAVWCTRGWTDFEQRVWQRAPESLRNHALMIVTRDARRTQVRVAARAGFEKVLTVPPLKVFGLSGVSARMRADDLELVLAQVRQVIDEAVSEDVDSALMFLHRFEASARRNGMQRLRPTPALDETPAPQEIAEDAPVPTIAAPHVEQIDLGVRDSADPTQDDARTEPPEQQTAPSFKAPSEALAALSRAFHYLRQRSAELLDKVPPGPLTPEIAEDLLGQFEDAVVSLVAFTEFELAISETWPDLHDAILAANEIALLLRIEGGVEQVGDAAALLFQLRQEIECELAA